MSEASKLTRLDEFSYSWYITSEIIHDKRFFHVSEENSFVIDDEFKAMLKAHDVFAEFWRTLTQSAYGFTRMTISHTLATELRLRYDITT